jgi:hypothetical protein
LQPRWIAAHTVANYLVDQAPFVGNSTAASQSVNQLDSTLQSGFEIIDSQGRLLSGSLEEAERHLASMRVLLYQLKSAAGLAPFIVVDPSYQSRHSALLALLLEQGSRLAHYETLDIISYIQDRNASGQLNRGLHLHVPYFDDRSLELKTIVISRKVLFVLAFIVHPAGEIQDHAGCPVELWPARLFVGEP